MFPEWTWIVGLLFGSAVGSFINVVIYRLPRGLSLGNPPNSFCPKCRHRLTVLDLFPLFSYLLLRGKCRHCGARVSSRYFFVELITGVIWAGLWHQYLVAGWDPAKGIAYALAASALVAIIFIDWELYIIPDQVNASLLIIGLAYNGWLIYAGSDRAWMWGMPSSVAGALVGIGALWGVAFLGRLIFRKDAMGHGDIKMARGIGSVLLPATALVGFGLAVILGAVLGIAQVLMRSRGPETDDEAEDEEGDYEPESFGSLFKSGLGYLLCIDIIGLFRPKLYEAWFGEDPFEPVPEGDDLEVERTMIPFGPYLALGAIVAAVFEGRIMEWVTAYWTWATRGAV